MLVTSIFGICLLFSFLSAYPLQNTNAEVIYENEYPIMEISRGIYPYYTQKELTEMSDLIIVGSIIHIEEAKWSTKNGKQPDGIRIEESVNKRGDKILDYYVDILPEETIYTDMVFSVETIHKGELTSKEIIIRSFSGTVGSFQIKSVEDFKEKEKTILYLIKDDGLTKKIGPEHYVILPGGKLTETTELDLFSTKTMI